MARFRYFLLTSVLLIAAPSIGGSHVSASDSTTESTVVESDATDSTLVWRLENDPSQCIGFLPKPNCGYEPRDAGERGGSLQITLFFVMMGALGVIGTVIVRNVMRRDAALARSTDRRTSADD